LGGPYFFDRVWKRGGEHKRELEKNEMDALLNAPDRTTRLGNRDYVLLLFMYNSGARADEVAQLVVADLNVHLPEEKGQA
jgi:site-specific recombinase XerD